MKTIYLNENNLAYYQKEAKPNVVALGCFDGLHHGHIKVIQTALKKAEEKKVSLSVMSFYPHPKTVMSGNSRFDYLIPQEEKEAKLKKLGVDTFLQVKFTKQFAALSPEMFVKEYLLELGVIHAVAGFDFTYGHSGAGNMQRLRMDSSDQIDVTTVEKLEYRGEKISSTSVRKRLSTGNVEELPHFLGQFYEMQCVWDGRRFQLSPHYTLPADGSYAVELKSDKNIIHTEVLVSENEIICLQEVPKDHLGNLTVVWKKRTGDGSYLTNKKKDSNILVFS